MSNSVCRQESSREMKYSKVLQSSQTHTTIKTKIQNPFKILSYESDERIEEPIIPKNTTVASFTKKEEYEFSYRKELQETSIPAQINATYVSALNRLEITKRIFNETLMSHSYGKQFIPETGITTLYTKWSFYSPLTKLGMVSR